MLLSGVVALLAVALSSPGVEACRAAPQARFFLIDPSKAGPKPPAGGLTVGDLGPLIDDLECRVKRSQSCSLLLRAQARSGRNEDPAQQSCEPLDSMVAGANVGHDNMRAVLLEQRQEWKHLKRWTKRLTDMCTDDPGLDCSNYRSRVDKVKTILYETMSDEGIFKTVAGGGAAAGFFETGLALRYYGVERNIRAEQPSIEPTAEASLSYRRDARFKNLTEVGGVTFDSPEDRLVARLTIADIRVVDRRSASAPALSFGFGVEHEFGLRKNGVPSATRIFFFGDLALLKVLRGGQ